MGPSSIVRAGAIVVTMAAVAAAQAPSTLDALVASTDALTREVAKLRGLRVKKPIEKEIVDREELRQRLITRAAEEESKRETEAEGFAYARWGLIPPATDYARLRLDLMSDQIAGYYDPKTKKLTIARAAVTDPAWAELVLAHEIEHGLQDQAFDLEKFVDLPATEGDARRARRALVEGDALATMIELMLRRRGSPPPWSNPDVTTALEKGMTIPGQGDSLDAAPLVVRESLMFPYHGGLSFVAALRRRQTWSAVDAAFAKPPRSTEHILHPERYQAGDDPIAIDVAIPPALAAYTRAHATVWGELGVALFLRTHGVDASTASIAGEGWGGDRVITLARPGDARPSRGVGIARFEWDSEPDAIEAAEALEKALDRAVVGGTIDRDHTRTRWLALDGTVSWIERKGPSIVVVLGAPVWTHAALATEVWSATSVRVATKKSAK